MPSSALDREAIEAEIDRVRSLGLDELRTLWRATFRSPPPLAFAKEMLWQAYESGDPYIAFAKQAGLAPAGATKSSHAEIRQACKSGAPPQEQQWGAPQQQQQ